MDLKQSAIKAINRAFSSEGGKLNNLESSNAKDSIVKQIQKSEQSEAATSGAAGVFVGPISGEMKEKWSEKYKKSINCKNPKGFSQKAHCQGKKKKMQEAINESVRTQAAQLKDIARKFSKETEGSSEKDSIEKMTSILKRQLRKGIDIETKENEMPITKVVQIVIDHLKENPYHYSKSEKPKKMETKEATGSGSARQYSGPAFGAKSMSPKHWRGRAKTQIPGGAFVQVKKKCKTFPYCNQGDINAVELSRNPVVKKKKKKLSEQYGVSEELIMQIILNELYKNLEK